MTNLNKKILVQIEKSECYEGLKSFLKAILLFELKHMTDSQPLYSKDYERAITTHMVIVEEEMEED
ncbi:MAG: hypothetical protein IBV52_07450 [Candidatus Bathyarchaeota archaeon]